MLTYAWTVDAHQFLVWYSLRLVSDDLPIQVQHVHGQSMHACFWLDTAEELCSMIFQDDGTPGTGFMCEILTPCERSATHL
mmetsp:Transcript_23645/g.45462  ORF Transcript_23645/g.45462 Transcript_23645/m.45462 type:complete len:81 (-) Transcript_23645:366-608(-)